MTTIKDPLALTDLCRELSYKRWHLHSPLWKVSLSDEMLNNFQVWGLRTSMALWNLWMCDWTRRFYIKRSSNGPAISRDGKLKKLLLMWPERSYKDHRQTIDWSRSLTTQQITQTSIRSRGKLLFLFVANRPTIGLSHCFIFIFTNTGVRKEYFWNNLVLMTELVHYDVPPGTKSSRYINFLEFWLCEGLVISDGLIENLWCPLVCLIMLSSSTDQTSTLVNPSTRWSHRANNARSTTLFFNTLMWRLVSFLDHFPLAVNFCIYVPPTSVWCVYREEEKWRRVESGSSTYRS